MARYIQRPENALKRANEFIDVGKPARALDTLQEVFRNKKWTYTWSESVIEPIMFKYLDLCVELKKSHIAKEGLFQYRNMFQLVNVGSLENVIRGYLRMAEERTESAQQQSSQAVLGLDDIDDIDNLATPESILMSAVCGEDAQDRSDRTILLPWVKFLWESYCQCLELLRVNSHCEGLYHDIARMAFSFCLKYNRKMEFRKLSEKLRKHLEDICKVSTQSANVSISKPETQQLNLDTRLYQLDSAIQMELWQEAYKAIEDIHGLMAISKKTPVPKTMANYYQKLAMVFWKAGNQLFHAAALLKLFQLSREMKKTITQDELQRMASHVLVATLAIPLPSAHPEFDRFIETDKSPLEKAQRLAVLLGLQQPPTRISLLKDITRMNVVNLAAPQFQSLYKWLEVDFSPLKLCKNVQSVIDFINQDPNNPLIQYIEALQDVTLVRLVRQISQVYQSIEFIRFLELALFANTYKLERILVDCVRHNDMQITIDHKKQCVHFGTDLSESQREDHPDGPTLQSMPSEQVRSQLVNMSVVLHRAIAAINPNRKKAEREKLRAQMVALYHENKVKDHQSILIRQKLIEDRKEYIERLNTEREEEEYRRQEEIQRQAKLAEQKRLEVEMEERERKRAENELQQIKERNLKDKKQQISLMAGGQKLLKIIEEKGSADPEEIAKEEQMAMLRERKEMQSKLKSQEKRIDYFERAKRQEELPLIEKYLAEKAVQDQVFWENQEKLRIENAITERANAVAQQERLQRIYPDRDAFLENLRVERKSHFIEKQRKFAILLEEERKKRMAQRIADRRRDRRDAWLAEKEEERNRKLEEVRLVKEEQDRLERDRKAKEREVEMEKLRIQGEKQRAREEEVEKKMLEKRAAGNRDVREDRDEARGGNRERMERDRGDKGDSAWRNAPTKDSSQQDSEWRNARGERPAPTIERQAPAAAAAAAAAAPEGPKDGVWRARTSAPAKENVEPTPAAAAGGNDKWRRSDRGQEDREPIRRSGPEDERRAGEDRQPMRRGDDRDQVRRSDDRPIRRGDDRTGGERGNFRRDDNREQPMRRSNDEGFRREDRRDDRRGDDRRGGNDDRRDRRPAGNETSDWRKKDESKRDSAGGGWRTTGSAPKDEEKSKEQGRPRDQERPREDSSMDQGKPKKEDDEWTSVRRR